MLSAMSPMYVHRVDAQTAEKDNKHTITSDAARTHKYRQHPPRLHFPYQQKPVAKLLPLSPAQEHLRCVHQEHNPHTRTTTVPAQLHHSSSVTLHDSTHHSVRQRVSCSIQ